MYVKTVMEEPPTVTVRIPGVQLLMSAHGMRNVKTTGVNEVMLDVLADVGHVELMGKSVLSQTIILVLVDVAGAATTVLMTRGSCLIIIIVMKIATAESTPIAWAAAQFPDLVNPEHALPRPMTDKKLEVGTFHVAVGKKNAVSAGQGALYRIISPVQKTETASQGDVQEALLQFCVVGGVHASMIIDS